MSGRMEVIADGLEPFAKDFRMWLLSVRFIRSHAQRPYTRSLAGVVGSGLTGPASWVAVGMRRMAKIGEARRA